MTQNTSAHILVVDDEVAILNLVKLILKKVGYQVTLAKSCKDALDELNHQAFDLIITDAIMPYMSGYELVSSLRRKDAFAQVPILMLTRKRHRHDVKRALEAGVTDYIVKPIDQQLLLQKVNVSLSSGTESKSSQKIKLMEGSSNATLTIPCKIVAISEKELIVNVPLALNEESDFKISSYLFDEIGIDRPILKFQSCTENQPGKAYSIKYSFMGVGDADLNKIKHWLKNQPES
tara:strand:- start:1246 stop:1947 length:702 start_codon:yes stop_codon:yes gene_type:complete